jgi:ribonuclease-3
LKAAVSKCIDPGFAVAPGSLPDDDRHNPEGKRGLTEASVEATLVDLESELGHTFVNRALLVHALTHRSLANEEAMAERVPEPRAADAAQPVKAQIGAGPGDNERMEFLGDAVLGLVVGETLFHTHPEWHEGELTRVRAQLVSRKHMAEVARAIGLGSYLRLSRGEERGGLRSKSTVLSNSMEAVLGALFLDGGLEPVRRFVRQYVIGEVVEYLAAELRSGAALGNFKSALQEHLQAERAGIPVYRLKSESGPDHRKRFMVEVRLRNSTSEPGKPLARGIGSTKKLAEQDAARLALERLTAMSLDVCAEATGEEPADEFEGLEAE